MIFNKNYDRSLWLMLSGDEVNRSKIAEVITNIPYELYEQIRKLIENYNIGITEPKEIYYEKDNMKYSVNISNGELSINIVKSDKTQNETIKLFIFPVEEDEISKMEMHTGKHLGGFSYTLTAGNIFAIGGELEEYDIEKTIFGTCVKVYANNKVKAVNTRKVDESRMPDDMYSHQFRNEKGITRLIRRKRK